MKLIVNYMLVPMFFVIGTVCFLPVSTAKADDVSLAAYFISHVANSNGICSLPRCPRGSLAVEMKKASEFIILAQNNNAATAEQIKSAADADKSLGKRIYVDKNNVTNIPFANKYVDLLTITDVTDSGLFDISIDEIVRVLSPNGKAVLCNADGGTLTESTVSNWLAASAATHFNFKIISNSFG